jgi:hypothetical protein
MQSADNPKLIMSWRGLLAIGPFPLIAMMGPDLTPSRYFGVEHYIPRYILLALSVGFGLNAIRRGTRADRLIGIAVLVVGVGLIGCVAWDCVSIIRR